MDTNVIVMVVTLLLPSGDSGVHVTPYTDASSCIEAAKIEATDPLVQSVECSELTDGVLMLQFTPDTAADSKPIEASQRSTG